MLDLNSHVWKDLTHAYGSAADIPELLERLNTANPHDHEPWFSLWSALCHQNDVYTASYAASPHIIAIAGSRPARDRLNHLLLASSIEAFRHLDDAPALPVGLQEAYRQGLEQASELILDCLRLDWEETEYRILLGGLAAVRGHPQLAGAIFELEKETECPNCQTIFLTRGYDLSWRG